MIKAIFPLVAAASLFSMPRIDLSQPAVNPRKRKPSGTNRTKIKAARKQKHKK